MNRSELLRLLVSVLLLGAPVALPAYERLPAELQFEITGPEGSPLNQPTDVAIGDGRVHVLDGLNHRVVVSDLRGRFLFQFGDAGRLRRPVGLCLDPQSRIYVADAATARLHVFGRDGTLQTTHTIDPVEGDERPDITDCSVGRNAEVFLVDNDNHRIQVYDRSGSRLRWWGSHGQHDGGFRYPATIARDGAGIVYVVDVLNGVVKGFEPSGKLHVMIGGWGITPGKLYRPKGVLVAGARVFVSDSTTGVVQVFGSDGSFHGILSDSGGDLLRLRTPTNMALDGSLLFVVEQLEHKVSVWHMQDPPTPAGTSDTE